MPTENSNPGRSFRWQLALALAALVLSLLPRMVNATRVETARQAGNSCASWHTIAAGETLSGIAQRYGVSQSALADVNNITNANQIFIGLQLCIPGGGVTVAQAAAPSPTATAVPTPPASSTPSGTTAAWTGKYYAGKDLSGTPLLTRQDTAIDFDWTTGSPHTSVSNDSFSASWSATSGFKRGTYRFSVKADDGVRIYVDGILALQDWNVHPATTTYSDVELTEGSHTVRVEYFEDTGNASITVWWEKLAVTAPTCTTATDTSLAPFWSHAELGCPTGAATTVWSAWQPFERGQMIWRLGGTIYSYANDGDWTQYTDSWDGSDLNNTRGTPPSGLQAPLRGFGHLWETIDAIFSDLGWATGDEWGFCARIQDFEKGTLIFGDTAQTCYQDKLNNVAKTVFSSSALQALSGGSWKTVCRRQTHGRLQPVWDFPTLGCPENAGNTLWTAWQPFDSGHMIWRQDRDAILVFESTGVWAEHSDDWDSQDLTGNRGTAGEGQFYPVRGFGYLWENNEDVFTDLGWGTAAEIGVCSLVQKFSKGTLYIGDSVDSCFTNTVNAVAGTPFETNPLLALSNGRWQRLCRTDLLEGLEELWSQSELGCPISTGGTIWASWQPFQTGHMIWHQGDDAIFTFVNGSSWARHADEWDDQEYTSLRGSPPQGFEAPVRGFGYLWENDDDVYGDLGWGTASERGFCAKYQQYEHGFLLKSDPVDSCLDGHDNEAKKVDFALQSIKALNDGSWTLK